MGEEPTNTIIDGTNVHDAYYETIDIVSSNSVLNGFTVINIKNNKAKPWCVLIDANYVEIYGNIITGGSIGIQSGFGKEYIFIAILLPIIVSGVYWIMQN